jgi:YD repeat-containing protein
MTITESDLSNNSIVYNTYINPDFYNESTPNNTFGITEPGSVTDTNNNVIPDILQAPVSTDPSYISENCPNLGNSAQPVNSVITWTVPGPNGGNSTYYFCLTWITYNTGFGYPVASGWSELGSGNFVYEEAYGGALGIQSVVLPNRQSWKFVYDTQATPPDWNGDPSTLPVEYGDLTELIYPTGGNIQYAYQTLYGCTNDGSSSQFVQQRTLSDGGSVSGTWQYGWTTVANSTAMTVTDPYGNDTVHTFNAGSIEGSCYTYQEAQTQSFAGSQSNNQILQTISRTFANSGYIVPSNTNAYVPINAEPTQISTTGAQTGTQTLGYSQLFTGSSIFTGGASSTQHLPYYFESPTTAITQDPSGTTIGNKTVYQWQIDQTAVGDNFMSGVSSTCMMSGDPSSCSTSSGGSYTSYGYDGNYNQNAVNRWINTTGTWNTTGTQYYSWGAPETITDPRNLTETIQYDGSGIFPKKITNALSQSDQYTYDDIAGNMLSHTDVNNNTTTYQYMDPLGRVTKITYPTGQVIGTGYNDSGRTVTTTATANPDPTRSTTRAYDGLGRVTQEQESAANNQTIYTDTTYDEMGRVTSVSNPHYAASDSTSGITSYAYDALGRKIMQCDADNDPSAPVPCTAGNSYQQSIYIGNTVDFYDELRNHWQRGYDVFGRVVKVLEPDGSDALTLETDYQYDPLGNLIQVSQWGGPSGSSGAVNRSFTYDSLSRLICASNPENSSAPCPSSAMSSYTAGTTSYSYDGDGNVLTKTSQAVNSSSGSQTIGYSYDGLNRICYTVFGGASPSEYSGGCPSSGPANVVALYEYDSSSVSGATNTVGRLTDEKSYAGSTLVSERQPYSYDAMGRLLNEEQCTYEACSSKLFQPAYQYDLAGNIIALTDGTTPSPTPYTQWPCNSPAQPWSTLTFVNCYDVAGRLTGITSNWADSTHPPLLGSAINYWAFGSLKNAALAGLNGTNALSLSRSYDSRFRITSESDTNQGSSSATPGSALVTITGAEQTN